MSDGIIDSSILIDCLRGHADAIAFLAAESVGHKARTHLFVAVELLAGARNKAEMTTINSFIQLLEISAPTEADGLNGLDWYRQLRLSHGVDWPDCQIAATALRLGVPVVTLNVKHFSSFPGLQVIRPYQRS